MNLTILGGGAWGSAIAIHLAKNHSDSSIELWVRDAQQAQQMQLDRVNQRYLPGVHFPKNLVVSSKWADIWLGHDPTKQLIVIATPLAGLEQTCQHLIRSGPSDQHWLWLCKGIDPQTGKLPHEIITQLLNQSVNSKIQYGVLSGPSFAIEVAKGLPCALTVASHFPDVIKRTQRLLHRGSMRIYASEDVVGVELGGAIKNILAIATGIVDGLGLGLNARAAVITRGMVEMSRLGQAMGAQAETFSGLAGLGDLILTATGDLSRNRRVGLELAVGKNLPEVLEKLGQVAEGVRCAQAVLNLARQYGVEMPIVAAVCSVLFEQVEPAQAVAALLARDPRPESGR
ncbi:MAG: NAD(P)-dependent glycerol-3-phosphate dehydrogenase [Polynucleobacter sp.]|jgi:glycerol-3-phosphate dehydrogenase (NAD(P)+)|nr:NAD(P)-dependent glycerol-3-phosphate dehydrogenase [Polynucleobacter sp.]